MAKVPTGYVFYDVSAKKLYAAGQTYPNLGNGDYLVPATSNYDGYYQQYVYYTSYTDAGSGLTWKNCWVGSVQGAYYSKPQRLPYNQINDKPVRFFVYNYCLITACPETTNSGQSGHLTDCTNLEQIGFYSCTKLTSAPDLPASIKSLHNAFYNTKITAPPGNFSSLVNLKEAGGCFWKCQLLTSAPDLSGFSALTDIGSMFCDCTSLTDPPDLPPNVENIKNIFCNCSITSGPLVPDKVDNMGGMFFNCASLSGNIRIETAFAAYASAFRNTTNQIILLGPAENHQFLQNVANTGNNKNVHNGIVAVPSSFTAIRGNYDSEAGLFTETVNGDDCKLTVSYNAPDVPGALLMIPTLMENDTSVMPQWHIGAVNGPVLDSSGAQIQPSGKLVAVLHVGNESSRTYKLQMNSKYVYDAVDYNWKSGTIVAGLAFSNLPIDINPTGTGICLWGEAPDGHNGLLVNKDVETTGDISAGGNIADNSGNVLSDKQDALVSGSNIKTINDNSLLGSGNITISELPPSPTLSTSGITAYSNRAKSITGGVLKLGKWRFVQIQFQINAALAANNYWAILNGFNNPTTRVALAATIVGKNGGAISAYIRTDGLCAIETDNSALEANDWVALTGWYIAS